ncbi:MULTISPECIES: Glu-tRNA(Gln) amidotransferase subunit GatD [Methanobacterium]|uniref:Glutamyl-tRNA(Gln) amidotransferase subunit D n=1 Tax=Methanobacterium veterum TaxID=408577 RepID=A0A9E4ZUH3_9EURY|nr:MULTISPECIES: Glu-tRNA(Gln) amidotransferase subunit GatD [Methanobacterium]MCZ3365236.1 Glu-tRNA(Gln) amidotransferase subunit GatD [Methanobacterium veterum]MCZ3372991.1 Glu-tRNA(Gln) amidotransferase subunit GatD [Methanobacterium veterum]
MSYRGASEIFLKSAGISIGDSVKITKQDISYEGMLLDRAEDADETHLVLKLKNGYNVGINIENATIELVKKGEKPKIELSKLDIEKDSQKHDISIISTGGTVASIIDYKTGAVHPAFTADDLIRANPELLEYANIKGKAVLNILSENMKPEYWVKSARSIADEINDGAYGVVVAHGTDTMHYTSAALSFMLDTPVPVVLTGAQRSSDRPSSDAFLNLLNSVTAAKSDIAEVMVCMHGTEDDTYCDLHRGTKVRKMHTSRRDTFRSINTSPLARVQNGGIEILDEQLMYKTRTDGEVELQDAVESNVAFIKSYPGISGEIIEYHMDKGYKGIVLEGTGLGHCPEEIIPSIKRARDSGIPVVMTSQCLYGKVNMNVYSTGRKLINAGVISAGDMLPETAYVKLCWALGQTDEIEEVEKTMQTNIAGEIEDKSSIKYFLM